MRVLVSNNLRIQDASHEVTEWCRTNLVLDNPDFVKKERLGKWTGNTPREIWLFEKRGTDLLVPYGCWRDIYKLYPDKSAWKGDFKAVGRICARSLISLYPYQQKAVESALNALNGVLVMPCGSGKTQCGLEIVSRLGLRTLWLTHTSELLNQSMSRAQAVLDGVRYGRITEGKVDVGDITFATVQTMARLDLSGLKHEFGLIIVDECHHCAGSPTRVTQFYKVVSSLAAKYKYGLTATPKRADGLERSMYALLGGICAEVKKDAVAENTCPIKIQVEETGWTPDYNAVLMGDGTIDYTKLINNLVTDEGRFEAVFEKIVSLRDSGAVMVLGNRVEYLTRLCDAYNEGQYGNAVCLSGGRQNKAAKAERKKALEALNTGELDVIFATYQLAKEGLDVPALRYVVFATPEQDETTVTQAAGRVGRKSDGKEYGTVIDFVDNFGMYYSWHKKRLRYYRKLDADVL